MIQQATVQLQEALCSFSKPLIVIVTVKLPVGSFVVDQDFVIYRDLILIVVVYLNAEEIRELLETKYTTKTTHTHTGLHQAESNR